MLLSVVLRNDWEINVIDYAKVAKMLKTFYQAWGITNQLYMAMQGLIID